MKKENQIGLDFGDGIDVKIDFQIFAKIIIDRGSKYSVSGGRVKNRDDIKLFLKNLKKDKKIAKATNSWASRISYDGKIWETKNDDEETGAGNVILNILRKRNFINVVVVVTRWFGGIKLQADRFKHLQDSTIYWLENFDE